MKKLIILLCLIATMGRGQTYVQGNSKTFTMEPVRPTGQTSNSYKVAKFCDKQKYYRAAVIYYNKVIREQPGSQESNEAKKRIGPTTCQTRRCCGAARFASKRDA